MRNEYLFRMANTVRTGVGAITSCGTNAVWNYPLPDCVEINQCVGAPIILH